MELRRVGAGERMSGTGGETNADLELGKRAVDVVRPFRAGVVVRLDTRAKAFFATAELKPKQ